MLQKQGENFTIPHYSQVHAIRAGNPRYPSIRASRAWFRQNAWKTCYLPGLSWIGFMLAVLGFMLILLERLYILLRRGVMSEHELSLKEMIRVVFWARCKNQIEIEDADWLYDEDLGWVHKSCLYPRLAKS